MVNSVFRRKQKWLKEKRKVQSVSDEDSDDVVILNELVVLNPKNTKKKKKKVVLNEFVFNPKNTKNKKKKMVVEKNVMGVSEGVNSGDDVDSDCVVLDYDPYKPVEIDDVSDSEDLLVVAEKGKIACRDYPHARHHCTKFPFAYTPHEQHCRQCHCYVCDTLAPCINWGNGCSKNHHCNSTDQNQYWRANRKIFKKGHKFNPIIVTSTNTHLSISTHEQQDNTPRDYVDPCLDSQQLPSSCNNNTNDNISYQNNFLRSLPCLRPISFTPAKDQDDNYDYESLLENEKSLDIVRSKGLRTWQGKHLRFEYPLEEENENDIFRSKGLPTWKGKRLRWFQFSDGNLPISEGTHLRFKEDD